MELRRFSFEKLEVYDKARALVSDVYRIQVKLPKEEKYGLGQNIAASKDSRPSVDFITTEGIAVNTH